MRYWEYFRRKATGTLLMILGSFIVAIGIFVLIYNIIIGIILVIIGFILIAYGKYILNKLRFDRESSGYRLYHQRGNY